MTAIEAALARLRSATDELPGPVGDGLAAADVRFVALGGPLETRWRQALVELAGCAREVGGEHPPILCEGGPYPGAWLESTATISTEILDRFAPAVSRATHLRFAALQRADGLLPYKVIDDGAGFSQIQLVTPLARSVWHHYRLTGDDDYLRTMYQAMIRMDAWLAAHRDTRGTGGVEAFCTFDTGHDLSPRFWFVPDRCHRGDATRWDPSHPTLPHVAPDLTANVACQRTYLARIAEELGQDGEPWRALAEQSRRALWQHCYDAEDGLFYDLDATGRQVRVASDVLLRVLACEIGDDDFFDTCLERYLLHTGKFAAPYGFTSLALDDPRFDHDFRRNSWGGPVNFLGLLRAPQAFDDHDRVAELAFTQRPLLAALARADRFPQCLDPWSGSAGYGAGYSPAILWLLDAVERNAGILPRPDGTTWLTALPPTRLEHGTAATASGYARTVDGRHLELVADDSVAEVHRDGRRWLRFPTGWRIELDGHGEVRAVVGLAPVPIGGDLHLADRIITLKPAPNQRLEAPNFDPAGSSRPEFVPPQY